MNMNRKNQSGGTTLVVISFIATFLVVAVITSLLGAALGIITLPWLKLNTQIQTNRDIITKTYDANNVVYNYEWFKQTAEDIKATQTQWQDAADAHAAFTTAAGPHDKWTFEDKTEDARLGAVQNGLKNHYTQLVADYNAHASEANRNIFQENLPTFFSLKPF